MNREVTAAWQTYAGLFLLALATLMYEILLTRIFSVTMWYHFAFVAVSVAMFGMTIGAMAVYLAPSYFTHDRAKYHLALSSLLLAVSIIVSFLTHLSIPFVVERSLVSVYSIALTYFVISIPFIFSGIGVCIALTKFPRQVSKLYAADLSGAALGCILLIYALRFTDGPTAVAVVALLASLSGLCFALDRGCDRVRPGAVIVSLVLASFAVGHTVLVHREAPVLRLLWVRGYMETRPLYERWNSFSRIRILGDPDVPGKPFGWGLSPTYPSNRTVRQIFLDIDAFASTALTAFNGSLADVEHLKYDVTNIGHYIRPDSSVLVIGTGGGRDILSALAFEQRAVVGIEINNDIIDAVNRRFGAFTGHLDRDARVTFINDEARSYLTRSQERFDIIQSSLVDTFAATAAGAFVLTENSLYTLDAWRVFLDRLTPRGILMFSWWYLGETPGEIYRLTALATAALRKAGVEKPRDHIVVVRNMTLAERGVGTVLVGRAPFSGRDLDAVEDVARRMQFDVVLSSRVALDATFASIVQGKDVDRVMTTSSMDITPPTDDRPFFFNMLRLRDVFRREVWAQAGHTYNATAFFVLIVLLVTVMGLTGLCIIVPLMLTAKRVGLNGALPLLVFFAGIGFGFMLIEISQMQRLIIFLGHPTYGLSVVLVSLLLAGGLGSYVTQRFGDGGSSRVAIGCLAVLLCVLLIFGALTPYLIGSLGGAPTSGRIVVAMASLFPLGLLMGMAFPLGMRVASLRSAAITPWLWGINGAASVCASVLAVVIAVGSGISAAFWTGFACYLTALAALVWVGRGTEEPRDRGSVAEG
jgi:hypothetical protein